MTNITQTLERLAVVAPEFVRRFDFEHEPKGWELIGFCRINDEIDKAEQALLFGAICEKCSSIPGWEIEMRDLGPFIKVTINVNKEPLHTRISFKDKDGSAAAAAASALLAALEGRVEKSHNPDQAFHEQLGSFYERMEAENGASDCAECQGKGNFVTYFKSGDVQSVAGPCPACQGSGNKQEVQA